MENQNNKSTSGITLSVFIFAILAVLRLTEVIDWSWIWITSPLWIPFALVGSVIVLGAFSGLMKVLLNKLSNLGK
jgi:hypothetical protein